jgi:hypothetical protein
VFYDSSVTKNNEEKRYQNSFYEEVTDQTFNFGVGNLRIVLAVTPDKIINQGDQRFDVIRTFHQMSLDEKVRQ